MFERPNSSWETERLINALSAKNCIIRVAAAESLGLKGEKTAIEPLFDLLRDKDSSVRWRAGESLEVLLDDSHFDLIRSGICDEDEWVRFWSAYLLGRCTFREDIVPELISALKDCDRNVRTAAADSLELVGDKRAIEPLLYAMRDEWRGARLSIFGALQKLVAENMDEVDPDLFLGRLDDECPDVRFASSFFLGELRDLRALEHLLEMINNPNEDENVRQWAAYALSRMDDDRAFNRLIDTVEGDESIMVRRMALRSLGEMIFLYGKYLDQGETCISSILDSNDTILLGVAQDILTKVRKERLLNK